MTPLLVGDVRVDARDEQRLDQPRVAQLDGSMEQGASVRSTPADLVGFAGELPGPRPLSGDDSLRKGIPSRTTSTRFPRNPGT